MQRLIASVTSSSVRRLRFNVRRPSRKLVQREVHGFTENEWRQVKPSAKEHRVSNIDTVREIYEHSGRRGDVGVILDPLDHAVDRETQVPVSGVPWLQARPGKSNIVGFFQALAPLKITRFEPRTFFDGGDKIFVLIAFEATQWRKALVISQQRSPLAVRCRRQSHAVRPHHRYCSNDQDGKGRMIIAIISSGQSSTRRSTR
jgi:hypothetical protein